MNECSRRLLRSLEEIAIAVQEVSRLEESEEVYESEAESHFERINILESALEKIASSNTKTVAACRKIAEEAIEESRDLI